MPQKAVTVNWEKSFVFREIQLLFDIKNVLVLVLCGWGGIEECKDIFQLNLILF